MEWRTQATSFPQINILIPLASLSSQLLVYIHLFCYLSLCSSSLPPFFSPSSFYPGRPLHQRWCLDPDLRGPSWPPNPLVLRGPLSTPHCVRVSRLLHDPRLAKKIFYIINKYNYYKFYRYPLNEYSVCCQFSMLGLPPLHANRIPSPYFSPEPLPRSFATPCPCFSSLPALPYPGTVSPTYGPPVRPSVDSSVRPRMATSTGGYHTRSHS